MEERMLGHTLTRDMSRKGAGLGKRGRHDLTPLLVPKKGMESKITGVVLGLLASLSWVSVGVNTILVSIRKQ